MNSHTRTEIRDRHAKKQRVVFVREDSESLVATLSCLPLNKTKSPSVTSCEEKIIQFRRITFDKKVRISEERICS